MTSNLPPKASPWQPNATSQMNVTATPFRPPPFSLSQDPLLAAVASLPPQHGAPSGGVGVVGSSAARANSQNGSPHPAPHSSHAGHGAASSYTSTPLHHGLTAGTPMGGSMTGMPANNVVGGGAPGPVKYKTELCRNWEATGHCAYRGCTYAHGYEDLRGGGGAAAAMMAHHHMAQMGGPQSLGVSPLPQQQQTFSFNHNVVNAGAALVGGPNSNRSSAMNTPVTGTYRMVGGSLIGPGMMGGGGSSAPPLAAGAGAPSAPAPIQTPSPQPISTSTPSSPAEQLLELIVLEMRAEKEKLLTQQTSNRSLEQQLKREQLLRQRNVNNITVVEHVISLVEEAIRRRHAALIDLKRAMGEDAMEAVVDAMLDGDAF